jgi:hypothetical protein
MKIAAKEHNHNPSRRKALTIMGFLPFAPSILRGMASAKPQSALNGTLPAKDMFQIKGTFLNAAYTHPMSTGTADAIKGYLDFRLINGKSVQGIDNDRDTARTLFARLINADPD